MPEDTEVTVKEEKYNYKIWFLEKLLPLIMGTLIITGGLTVYTQKTELTKFTFQNEYKPVVTKATECQRLHSEYLDELVTYSGLSRIINDKFNSVRIAKYGNAPEFAMAFKATLEAWGTAKEKQSMKKLETTYCYQELTSGYENLAILLGLDSDVLDEISFESEKIANLRSVVNDKRKQLENIDFYKLFDDLSLPRTEEQIKDLLDKNSYQLLSELGIATANLEMEIANLQRTKNFELKKIFSKELKQRFGNGVIRSIPEMWL
jgi:hypothetical protein